MHYFPVHAKTSSQKIPALREENVSSVFKSQQRRKGWLKASGLPLLMPQHIRAVLFLNFSALSKEKLRERHGWMKLQDEEKEILNYIITCSFVSPLGFLNFAEEDD